MKKRILISLLAAAVTFLALLPGQGFQVVEAEWELVELGNNICAWRTKLPHGQHPGFDILYYTPVSAGTTLIDKPTPGDPPARTWETGQFPCPKPGSPATVGDRLNTVPTFKLPKQPDELETLPVPVFGAGLVFLASLVGMNLLGHRRHSSSVSG